MKFALKSLDDLSCSNPSGVRNEISAFLLLPRIHIIRRVCLLKRENRVHNNRSNQTQSIWISTRLNVLEIPRMRLDISMETCFSVGSHSSWSPALSCHFLCFCSSGLNWPIIPQIIGSRSEFIKQPTLLSYYWFAKWFVILSNSFSMVGHPCSSHGIFNDLIQIITFSNVSNYIDRRSSIEECESYYCWLSQILSYAFIFFSLSNY